MKTLLFTFALLIGLAGCATTSNGAHHYDYQTDQTSIYEG